MLYDDFFIHFKAIWLTSYKINPRWQAANRYLIFIFTGQINGLDRLSQRVNDACCNIYIWGDNEVTIVWIRVNAQSYIIVIVV